MKKVATSLATLESSEPWQRILSPSDSCEDLAVELLEHWAYDLYERRPRAALLDEGVLKPTDLDLACFLAALAGRGAVIDLPRYELRRQATFKEGEHVVSKDHRHGKVLGLTSNREVFSFSVKIADLNVVFNARDCEACHGKGRVYAGLGHADIDGLATCRGCGGTGKIGDPSGDREEAGAPRNFMLVDLDGTWHEGWKEIVFSPKRQENEFLTKNKLWTGNKVYFENFVHPNRWTAFYGKWYLLTKLLVERFRMEASFCGLEVKRIQMSGVSLPKEGPDAQKEYGAVDRVGAARSIKVPAFEAEIDADVPHEWTHYPTTLEGLVAARRRMNHLRYEMTPALNFHVRATELAFAKKANVFHWLMSNETMQHHVEPFPSWVSGASWEHGYLIKRTPWNRLVLGQRAPFVKGMALRYRVYEKSERVAA